MAAEAASSRAEGELKDTFPSAIDDIDSANDWTLHLEKHFNEILIEETVHVIETGANHAGRLEADVAFRTVFSPHHALAEWTRTVSDYHLADIGENCS